ncbi:hypothetical protein PCANC_24697 [Puccinia coronata f. sp. avenae]|uniref:F-box protein Hrt3/FBXO9 C-terminal domain-containing protein n=1 Tax=Puccinia coronata f. sp. avenae TaxID=200324 RepID=A0A2N5UIW1_9BASI|nr:hypothetical protein PCANC_24697 [Puccinia coronata f. sp. avenae]PLW37689.1 hypothetical protein PCASD_12166 [Puccinia coronata f. sp. avenae]
MSSSNDSHKEALERFRQEWIEEVKQSTTHTQSSSSVEADTAAAAAAAPPPSSSSSHDNDPLAIYARAAYYERIGLLDDALTHYRKALRLEPNIHLAYQKLNEHQIASLEPLHQTSYRLQESSRIQLDEPEKDGYHIRPNEHEYSDGLHPCSTTRFLNYLLASFQSNPWRRPQAEEEDELVLEEDGKNQDEEEDIIQKVSALEIKTTTDSRKKDTITAKTEEIRDSSANAFTIFEPLELERSCPIQRIPLELFDHHILSAQGYSRSSIHMLVSIVETFARVSRLARIVTLSTTIWQAICLAIYSHDLFVNTHKRRLLDWSTRAKVVDSLCREAHAHDWRRMFIQQPRLRLDGCYISLVRYPRLGESSNPWYTPTHFVTYFRYLRFLEDGRCVSFTSTDEPGLVVRSLGWRSSTGGARGASTSGSAAAETKQLDGVLYGLWTLEEDRVRLFKLHQDPQHLLLPSNDPPFHRTLFGRTNYEFEIQARLLSTRLGKMNKLEIIRLSTINLNSGEVLEVPLPMSNNEHTEQEHETSTSSSSSSSRSSKPFIFSRVISYDPL